MSDSQARIARDDVYDHEHEEPRSGRRRRPVADWGVGDDVFEYMPRNRFSRAAEGPPRERRFSTREGAERPPARPIAGEPARPVEGAPEGRRTIVIDRPEDVPSEIAAITVDRHLGEVGTPAEEAPETVSTAGERRTVRIAGRPEASLEAARFHREHAHRRPPRTAHERVGARPDRLAMWAVALGLLLILIALLTAI